MKETKAELVNTRVYLKSINFKRGGAGKWL